MSELGSWAQYQDLLNREESKAFTHGLVEELKPFHPQSFETEVREFYNIDFNNVELLVRLNYFPNDEYKYVFERDELMHTDVAVVYERVGRAAGKYFSSLYIKPDPNVHILGEE